ncbi:MAG: type III pantothenate kinase [Planctomycetaceae bacterium]
MKATVAVDLGNSAAKWSVDGQAEQRVSLRTVDWVDHLIRDAHAAAEAPVRWRIASVNRPSTKLLLGRLQDAAPNSDVRTIACDDVPMVACVANPDRVGIDRLLAAWMASRLFPAQSLVVVDAGSAITVDVVSRQAEFLGGVILPGISLQFDSLARGTDALPAIELLTAAEMTRDSLPLPAKDTVSAIRSGILLGAAAAIEGLVREHMARSGDQDAVVVLTGGDARLLSGLLERPHQLKSRLVLDAIRSLP